MFLWIVGGPQTRLDLDPSANHMCSKARGRPCWMVYRRGNSVTSYNLPIFFFFFYLNQYPLLSQNFWLLSPAVTNTCRKERSHTSLIGSHRPIEMIS